VTPSPPGFDHGSPRLEPASAEQLAKAEALVGEAAETNMERTLAQAPNVLRGYLAFENALARGSLRPRLVEQVAITMAEENRCLYCLSAHLQAARNFRLAPAELERNREGHSEDPRAEAVLQFARALATSRGSVSEEELRDARAAGLTESELMQVVGLVALNVFTNYFNRLARPVIDFPIAEVST
jgi:uncharacterized peroxidase-related enzyme